MHRSRTARTLLSLAIACCAVTLSKASILPEYRIIVFRPDTGHEQRAQIAGNFGCRVLHDLWIINAISCETSPEQAFALDRRVKAHDKDLSSITRVDKDMVRNWLRSDAPSFAQTRFPGVDIPPIRSKAAASERKDAPAARPWGIERVRAPQAWPVTRGAGVNVAVIDTGIDYNHPALKARIKGGANVVGTGAKAAANDFLDDNGHGSHVSGIIAAQAMPNGVVGVAPEVDLYGVKVLNADGSGTFGDVIAGIQWAADPAHHIDLANMSLGADTDVESLSEAVKKAAEMGLTIIAAAGNSSGGPVGYPAAYPQVIAVSASNNQDQLAYFSSVGPQVAVIAPGDSIFSSYKDGGYETLSGTSMACPHTVGVAALAVSVKHLHGVAAVRAALQSSATPLNGLDATQQGAGLVSADKIIR